MKRLLTLGVSAALCTSVLLSPANFSLTGNRQAEAITLYNNAEVANQGSATDEAAIIRGGMASVGYDSTRKSNVLQLQGDSFGAGWLQLPAMFGTDCKDGFTFSMRFSLDNNTEKYMRLFQFSSIPFGMGNAPSYNSPDISVDLKDKTAYRASIFVGNTTDTVNDEKHRAIFDLSAAPDADTWHQLSVVYAPDGVSYYLDGTLLSIVEATTLDATLNSLFSDNVLSSYTYNSIGHSLYSDHDLLAKVDDVTFYNYALSASQVKSLPDNAKYLYTFEEDTITEGEAAPAQETAVSLERKQLTSVPELQVTSPDGTLIAKFWTDSDGSYYYSAHKISGGTMGTVIEPSRLGLITTTENLSTGFSRQAPAAVTNVIDESYTMPYGKHSSYHNYCNELSFPLSKGDSVLTVTMRVYDDGIGYRYNLNHGASIKEEASQLIFPENSVFWGNTPNATYEWDMVEMNTQRIHDAWADYSVPFTGRISNRYWVLASEANVFNEANPYCAGCLSTNGGSRALKWKFGVKTSGVTMSGAFKTPWRATIITDNLNDMSSSDLILNLNPPSVLDDISWVKPGKVAWSWWSSGGDSPVEYHTQKDYIDFAADNGWDYVCLDFGWALWDNSAEKVRELCAYGAERGIGIYLWYGVNNQGHSGYKDSAGHPAYPYYSLLDEQTIVREFERISGLGVKGVKVDYYESDTQETMKQMYLCMSIAAKNHLMVLFHGCTCPRGESRTYPNIVSYEAVNGTEYYKWFTSPSLQNRVSYTFTRNVVGSADFTPTGLAIYGINATPGFALADVVTIESGVQHFAHSVYTYEGNAALPLLNDIPVKWDEFHVLDGYPMQFNVTARRNGANWYVGASTIAARNIEIKLSELIQDDGVYNAYIFGDNQNGTALEVTVLNNLTRDSVIKRALLANGGCVVKITKGNMKLTTPYSNYKFYEAESAQLSGAAKITSGKDGKYCSGNAYVGYVGGNGSNYITFSNVNAPADGEFPLRIYYVSGEPRTLKVDVNGAFSAKIDNCYANKNDWSGIRAVTVNVKLKKGDNVIKLYNESSYGPSIDRIALAIPADDEDILYGDVNMDDKIDARDLALLKSGLLKGFSDTAARKAADFNMDGKLDSADAQSLVLFLTGQF